MYDRNFIMKMSNQNHESKTFIVDSGATSHMVNSEENMTNLRDAETRVTIGDTRTLTGKKRGNWYIYQRRGIKLHCVTLFNTELFPGLHAYLFNLSRLLKKGF